MFTILEYDLTFLVLIIITLFFVYLINQLSRPYDLVVDSYKYKRFKNRDGNQYDENPPSRHPNGWILVLESSQLSRNQIKPINCFGKDLIVYRGSSGNCYVFDAYCPHLGANLGIGGVVTGESIVCPFHGWVFDMNGKCTHVPGTESISKANINKYEAIEQNDCILVWHHSNGHQPDWYPPQFEELNKSIVNYIGRGKIIFDGYIQDVIENGTDYQHTNKLHGPPVFLGNLLVKPNLFNKILKIIHYEFEPRFRFGTGKHKHTARLMVDSTLVVFGYRVVTFKIVTDMFGPYLNRSEIEMNMLFKFNVYFHEYLTQEQNINILIRTYSDAGKAFNWIISRTIIRNLVYQVERDCIIWANKKFIAKPIYTKHEKTLAEYRRWFSQFY